MAIIDDLFKQGSDYFTKKQLPKVIGTSVVKAPKPAIGPLLISQVLASNLDSMMDNRRFNKSLNDYYNVAYPAYLERLGRKPTLAESLAEKQREYADFARLYNEKNPFAPLVNKAARGAVVRGTKGQVNTQPKKATSTPVVNNDKIDTNVPVITPSQQADIDFADSFKMPPVPTTPSGGIPSETRTIPTVDNGLIKPMDVKVTPIQQQGTPTGGAAGMTPEDILNYARQMNEMRREVRQPVSRDIQAILDNYGDLQRKSYYKDLGLAAVAGLSKNNAYASLMGKYTPLAGEKEQLALQQELANQQAQQIFDPYPIIANMNVMQQLGLDPITAMANKDILGTYSKIKGNEMSLQGREYAADQALAQARMIQDYINKREEADRELAWYKAKNPQFNTMASQAQMASALLTNANNIPAIREQLSNNPELLNYMIQLTGFKPTGNVPAQPQAQAKPQARQSSIGKFGGR